MMKHWKKGVVTAALSIAILSQGVTAHASSLYKAKDSDTFWKLSAQFGVSVAQLKAANPGVNANNIYQGLSIVIPSSVTPKAAPAAVKASKVHAASIGSEVSLNAVDRVQEKITISGRTYDFSDVVQVKASAYTAAAEENGNWGAVDYFGNPLKLGTIAVDPKVIPMGSKVFVTGYDHDGLPVGGMLAIASDQGGAIKGDRIDIFLPQSRAKASSFGFQYVKVFVLE
ncbi:3D domain-containing protein [Paenibacillus sp. R14(2021)]|uniref:3D domain-containing protein n=1 Tax=Paenibacillus sp. R14(2021) TaxID=2859228 RepID=UPI0021581F3E|nr:3D domain-containing protein [Paenibacillus sp. R14(2021)]